MSYSSTEDMRLKSILNMDNLKNGGLKTEYGLYALSSIVKDQKGHSYEALDILDDLSKSNFRELNEKNNTRNEDIIIDVMYDVANNVVRNYPKLRDRAYNIMMITEKNNERYVNPNGRSRKEFMDTYKQLFNDRIQEAKEHVLNHRAEKQANYIR